MLLEALAPPRMIFNQTALQIVSKTKKAKVHSSETKENLLNPEKFRQVRTGTLPQVINFFKAEKSLQNAKKQPVKQERKKTVETNGI